MTRRALWPAGLVAWAAVAYVVGIATTPAADGCDDRAMAAAFAWGGTAATALIGVDVARRRKVGPGILLGWTIVSTLAAWDIGRSTGDDCDHLVGLGMSLTFPLLYAAVIGGPIAAVYFVWRGFVRLENRIEGAAPPRRWRVEVKGWSLVITRRKPPG